MIEIKNLTKVYGSKKAVDDISFTVNRGEILGFLGPNGAGKTTTMNIITGYIAASGGNVTVDGLDVVEKSMECRRKIGYLPEQPPLYMDMTVSEYLNFVYELKGAKEEREEHLSSIMEMVKITDVKDRIIRNLSKGYKQRVGIAQALVGNPEVLILDEPTVGLDPKQIIEIRNVIKELGKKRTVILSSHILPEVSAICERVIIINKGKIVAIDTPENLSKALSTERKLIIRVEGSEAQIESALSKVDGISYIESLGQKETGTYDYLIEATGDGDIRKKVFSSLALAQLPILMSKTTGLTLEEVFMQLTSGEDVQAEDEPLEVADKEKKSLFSFFKKKKKSTEEFPVAEEAEIEEIAETTEEGGEEN